MPSQVISSVENNFTKGLVTEFTGMNFPENAATDTDNCTYTLVGDVLRRQGIDFEVNRGIVGIDRTNASINTYKWDNAGGDGLTQLMVTQVGTSIFFWDVTAATNTSPLSQHFLSSFVNLGLFVASGAVLDGNNECQFSDGNGYLFIFHPNCDPIYCTYAAGVVTPNRIDMKVRDFAGIAFGEGPTNQRPGSLSVEHQYNLMNQGWSSGPTWVANYAQSWTVALGTIAFTVASGITPAPTAGQLVYIQSVTSNFSVIPRGTIVAAANVVSYVGTTLTLNVGGTSIYAGQTTLTGNIYNVDVGYINTFKSTTGVYPSNSDVWWYFKNTSNVFDPATTINQVTLAQGNAPQGHYLFNPFFQDRGAQTGLSGLTTVSTPKRPTNGCWFQGRVWYTGVEASQQASGDAAFNTWTESIYFSQVVGGVGDFGKCYQENDPTSENLNGELSTDGGVIIIQGAGTIYKLFPTQNGLLVFAANGIWFITGSQGIGFSATDYTITNISYVRSISSTSFVNVQGLPYFWNEEGIYSVSPAQQGGFKVDAITVGTILTFYNAIPASSKVYARGAYHSIDYTIQWIYRSTTPANPTQRYSFDKILNHNVYNKSFFPYTVDNTISTINGICYVSPPGTPNSADPVFKYFASFPDVGITQFSFAEEYSTAYTDWTSTSRPINYTSYFITGYKLHGQAQKKFSIPYILVYSKNPEPHGYLIQSIWDYAGDANSNRWSVQQRINNFGPHFTNLFRRIRLRGSGYVMQIKITSQDGMPFDILGWSVYENLNQGV